jgi:hypothetical protein
VSLSTKTTAGRRKWIVSSIAIGGYSILWLLTQALGSPRALDSERTAEMNRLGSAYAENPMRARAVAPFLVKVDRLFFFKVTNLASGEATVRTFRTTSLYLWVGISVRLADGLWESEVKTPPAG